MPPHCSNELKDRYSGMTPPADTVRYKNHRFPGEIISHGVWLYYHFTLSYRDVQELLFERGITVSHEAVRQWCRKFGQDYANRLRRRRPQPGDKWHLDETYVKVKGQWRYLYRAVDKTGQTIDFLLTEQRDEHAAKRFLIKAIRRHGVPAKITIDGSAANEAAIKSYNAEHGTAIA